MHTFKQTLNKLRYAPLLALALFVASVSVAVTAQPAQALGEKYKWKDSDTIIASGGVFGGYSYELKRSKGMADSGGNPVVKDMYMMNDIMGIKDPNRDCNLRFGLVAQNNKAKGTINKLFSDPITVTSECPDINTMSRDVSISNAGGATVAPEKLNVTIFLSRPTANGNYDKDTVRLNGADGKTLKTKELKAADIKTKGDDQTAEVNFNSINAKQESFLEACSATLDKCSKSGNLAELLLEPLADNKVVIELAAEASDEEETAEETTCGIDGIGWIVCPVMTFMAKLNDSAFGFLQNLLAIRPALITDDATLKAWSAFRDVANVAFIIAFLFIVYSQVTSVGISNYGIKKLLPRIFVAAVLVNLSYFICALAVDVSNIVGSSIYSFLADSIPVDTDGATNGEFANGWQDTVGPILAGAAALAALLFVVAGASMAVLLALAVVLFILIARQALVILLIVIAPLAFVAYLLPNTESWFKKWRQAFVTVLMVYPIIGVIFGASTLAATILIGVSNDNSGNSNDEQLLKIVALATLAIPLFAVPLALKGSLSAAGAVGAKLNNLADRASNRATKQAGERAGQKIKGMRDAAAIAATNRAGIFGGQGKVGRAFGAGAGYIAQRNAKREQFYDTLGRRRKASDETFLNTNEKTAARERRAIGSEETAGLAKDANKNRAKLDHLRDSTNHSAYNASQQSGLELHDEEAVHKAAATQTYLGNAQNTALRTAAVQAGTSASNVEETVKNNAVAGYMNAPANQQQYTDLNASKGDAKNAQLNVERNFEGSAAGLNQALDRKATEGQLDIIRGEQKAAFDATATGVNQAVLKDATAKRQVIASAAGEAAAIAGNTDIRVNAQAAQDEVEVAKADESAFISELRTEAGASKNLISQQSQEVQDTVARLQNADTQRRVQTQRTASATGVANLEYAKQVQDVSSGLAEIAGGVDQYGTTKAIASAKATVTQDVMKNIENIQSTMALEESSDPALLQQKFSTTQSVEEKIAYLKAMYKNGSPGVEAARQTLTQWTADANTNSDDITFVKDVMQADQGFQKAGRDFEVWSNNERSIASTDANGQTIKVPHASFGDVTADTSIWANISAQRFASMNSSSQARAFAELDRVDPSGNAKAKLADRIYSDSTARGLLKESPLQTVKDSRLARGLDFSE